jgi:hypothetical protein
LDRQFPNKRAMWMYDLVEEQMPGFDLVTLLSHLRDNEGERILNFPICYEMPDPPQDPTTTVRGDLNTGWSGKAKSRRSIKNEKNSDNRRGGNAKKKPRRKAKRSSRA